MNRTAVIAALLIGTAAHGADSDTSPYVGQEHREIKALSTAEIADLWSGKGMGLAKAAELNGYAGPAHVLELASQLDLTPEQLTATKKLHQSMQSKAITLGRLIVEREEKLDRMFAAKVASSESITALLGDIGNLQATLRTTHLDAHLTQAKILTAQQSEHYSQLRGYSATATHPHQPHSH